MFFQLSLNIKDGTLTQDDYLIYLTIHRLLIAIMTIIQYNFLKEEDIEFSLLAKMLPSSFNCFSASY